MRARVRGLRRRGIVLIDGDADTRAPEGEGRFGLLRGGLEVCMWPCGEQRRGEGWISMRMGVYDSYA